MPQMPAPLIIMPPELEPTLPRDALTERLTDDMFEQRLSLAGI